MIAGVGVDLVDIDGFRRQLTDRASRFVEGTFTLGERQYAHRQASDDPARHLAVRFAAKEAFVKAWSGGRFGHPPHIERVDPLHVEVINDAWGRPAIRLDAALADVVGDVRIHVSLSHDGQFAIAQVMLEAPTRSTP